MQSLVLQRLFFSLLVLAAAWSLTLLAPLAATPTDSPSPVLRDR